MGHPQHDTPKKAKLQGAAEFLEYSGLPYKKRDLFEFFEVSRSAGQRILQSSTSRTLHNNPECSEPRGRKRALSEADLQSIEDFLDTEGFEARRLPYSRLLAEANIDANASDQTIRTSLAQRSIHKRLAQQVDYVDDNLAAKRLEWSENALALRPQPEDWHEVFFSDEKHYSYGDEDQALILRKPSTRNYPENLQERKEPAEKDLKRLHCWAAIGFNFKSPLIWYSVPSNSNGKMSQAVYIKAILKGYIKKELLDKGVQFILEEDGDSGHGPGQKNPARTWKEEHGLRHFFNCPQSPDLSPIENAWLVVNEEIKKRPHWSEDELQELAEEGWRNLSQETINGWIESMPTRLKHVIKLNGKRTAF